MNVPLSIAKYIRSLWMAEMITTYLHIDKDGKLGNWGGYPRHYGLNHLRTGEPGSEQIPFLEGILPVPHTQVLEFVGMENGRCAHVHIIPFFDGTWIIMFDATAEHDRQQKIQQQYNELSILTYRQQQMLQELENTRHVLQEEKNHLAEVGRLKTEFIASLSHELRTPLTSILGYTRLMDEAQKMDERQAQYLDTVQDNANHLLSLIDNILDDAQLETGSITLNPVHCSPQNLFRGIMNLFMPQAAEKGLRLALQFYGSLPQEILVDELRLRQVLINLITNALKFTETGSVSIEASWHNGQLHFSVADTGPGISASAQQKIFEPYHREKSTNSLPGAGLGLAITRHLLELMGGDLQVQSILGEGSTFSGHVHALLPQQQPANLAEFIPDEASVDDTKTTPTVAKNTERSNILLAEDTSSIRMLMEIYLEEGNYQTLHAVNGEEAIRVALEQQPRAVLMDMQMPLVDGYEAIRVLREKGYKAPIIAVSASDFPEDKQKALAAGCDAYIVKPVGMEQLLDTVADLLS